MDENIVKKYALSEVVLLAIFVIGLIIAYIIVLSRSYIKMSSALDVPCGGFSFSMPKGGGWQSDPFKFSGNSYYVTAYQGVSSDKVTTRLTVIYSLTGGKVEGKEWLKSKAYQMGGRVADIRTVKGKNTLTYTALIEIQRQPIGMFYGICRLADGRTVIIEAVDAAGEQQWGWSLITAVAKSFTFKGEPLLEEGQKIVAAIKEKGLKRAMGKLNRQEYFIVSENDQTEGFEVQMNSTAASGEDLKLRFIDSYFLRSGGGRESMLETNDRFDSFVWVSSALKSTGVRGDEIEIRFGEDAFMSVRYGGGRYAQEYMPGTAAIAEPFSDAIFREMAATGVKMAMFDLIDSQGNITPVIVELLPAKSEPNNPIKSEVKIKYLAQTSLTEELYLNSEGLVNKAVLTGPNSYILTRVSKEMVLTEFPLWLDYLIELEKIIEQGSDDTNKKQRSVVFNVSRDL